MSRNEFAHILWAALRTVEQWESGECVPVGMHHRLLLLLEKALTNPSVQPRFLKGSSKRSHVAALPTVGATLWQFLETLLSRHAPKH